MGPRFNIDLPLDNIFCFPVYFYFILVAGSWLFLYIVVKILNCLQSPSNKQLEKYTNRMKAESIELLGQYTQLPLDLCNIIVNEYIYDQDQNSFWNRMMKGKLNTQHRCTQIFIASYAI